MKMYGKGYHRILVKERAKNFLQWALKKTNWKRVAFFLILDGVLICLSMWTAFLLRFEGSIPGIYFENIWIFILTSLFIKIFFLYLHGLYRISWSYISTEELFSLLKALLCSFLAMASIVLLLRSLPPFSEFPRSIVIIDLFVTLLFIGSFRVAKRMYFQILKWPHPKESYPGKRTLIVGAGDAGEQIVRNMLKKGSEFSPIGFVDDDGMKAGISIHNVRVLGKCEDIPTLAKYHNVENLVIAMASATSKAIREIVRLGKEAKIPHIRIIPTLGELISGEVSLSEIREVQLEDLLGREPVEIKAQSIKDYLEGKTVLVTGAGGSIGSELSRQVLRFNPQRLIMLDQDETSLFNVERRLREISHLEVFSVVGDVKNESKMHNLFIRFHPQVVFHAAAYKHVPLMETCPDEAVRNDIIGALVAGKAASKFGAEKFVLISTDKAVNPASVMGATKRVAELFIEELNERDSTRFSAVRFGNVLGSRGSVVPIFKEQITKGGPVTVTHPEMKRYFMTPSEAALLVLQAGAMGEGGEVFVLDMGEPIKIVDLAKELIRLSGYEPDVDIPIVFTGIRPGEKLFETLFAEDEDVLPTDHEKILVVKVNSHLRGKNPSDYLRRLTALAERGESAKIVNLLREMVPSYHPMDQESLTTGRET